MAFSLAEGIEAARAAWPGVEVDPERFARYAAERDAAPAHLVDLWLACACSDGDAAAIQLLGARCLSDLGGSVRRIDPSPGFQDEVRQRVLEKLLVGERPRIAEYAGRGSLLAWVRVVALRTALNLRRDEAAASPPGDTEAEQLLASSDPELRLIQSRWRDEFRRAFAAALGALTVDERRILRLHYVDGLPLEKIGVLQRVNRTTAWRWLTEARETLSEALREELRARLSHSEATELAEQVNGQLQVSLGGLLRTTA